jgi:hypothetical protein
MKKERTKVGLETAGFGLFHLFLHRKETLRAETFLGQRVAVQDAEVFAVEGVVDGLVETSTHLRLVAVTDGFEQHVLEAVASKTSPRTLNTWP